MGWLCAVPDIRPKSNWRLNLSHVSWRVRSPGSLRLRDFAFAQPLGEEQNESE